MGNYQQTLSITLRLKKAIRVLISKKLLKFLTKQIPVQQP